MLRQDVYPMAVLASESKFVHMERSKSFNKTIREKIIWCSETNIIFTYSLYQHYVVSTYLAKKV